jgi:hypothetical protein
MNFLTVLKIETNSPIGQKMFRLKFNQNITKFKKLYNTQKPKNVFKYEDPLNMEKLLTPDEIEIRDIVRKLFFLKNFQRQENFVKRN